MSQDVYGIAAIVLASGLSRRFGERNKLLEKFREEAIVRLTVRAYVEAGLDPVLVVTGHEGESVLAALEGLAVVSVSNPDYREGQSRSLAAGVRALPGGTEAAVIGVGDQPFLSAGVIGELVHAYRRTGAPLVVARYGGVRGNPVLFDRSLFGELLRVAGDQGGRPVLQRHIAEAVWVDVVDAHLGFDVDTPEDLARLEK